MFDLMLKDRLRTVALSAERSKRSVLAGVLTSRLLAWTLAAPRADRLLIVPQDLRTADPSFWREIEHGQFGLAGSIAFLNARSPFAIIPPTPAWERELHGFGWLRHLAAAPDEKARHLARRLATEWAARFDAGERIGAAPAVAAQRLISWISHAALLLDGADAGTYETITSSLGRQLALLSSSRRDAPDGYPRLIALIALVLVEMSIAGHERRLNATEAMLDAELGRQILPDGGHISRHPGVLVEIMLDLLPLSQCFVARSRKPPPQLIDAMARILPMLRFLRMGDGMLARFNGMSTPSAAGLGTVLAYDDGSAPALQEARASGYARLERGKSIVIVDVGVPPPLPVAGEAQAGCLSFEMSSGAELLLVNGGMPGAAGADWYPAARATASHNTLCLAEKSSSKLVRHRRLEELIGAPPIRHPDTVDWRVDEEGGNIVLEASHDGYHRRFGLIHTRRLALSSDGNRLVGCDRLDGQRAKVRLRSDLPLAIHFHLHPDVACWLEAEPNTVALKLPGGERWRFSAYGAALSIEESTFFANSTGPRGAMQIVLRAATHGESEVNWVIERASPERAA
ncbi:MAG TPA: heparinase II/III family protein [Hyphomicrobium sp.]|jgi:uncharacterized heparinase superfamily protein